jgi:hypothetical protein
LVGTHHSAVASGHHRSAEAMDQVLRFFASDKLKAHAIARHYHTEYLVYCSGDSDMRLTAKLYPRGLAAELLNHRQPPWLHATSIDEQSGLQLYRIDL